MFTKTITTAALVLGMVASSAAFAGPNTVGNAPATAPAAAVAAAINSASRGAGAGVTVTVAQTATGDFVITNADTGAVIATVSSSFIAAFLSNY